MEETPYQALPATCDCFFFCYGKSLLNHRLGTIFYFSNHLKQIVLCIPGGAGFLPSKVSLDV